MNKIIITGNLTADPQMGTTTNNLAYCNFTVANTYANQTSFFRVTAWRNQAIACGNSLKKGHKVLVSGNIAIKQYDNGDKKGYNVEVAAQEVEFLTPKNATMNDHKQTDLDSLDKVDEELPF